MKYIWTGIVLVILILVFVFINYVQVQEKKTVSAHVSQVYVNSIPGVNVTAGFFEIKNTGKFEITVDGISSPVTEKIEFHKTDKIDGKIMMRKVNALVIGVGKKLKLENGGTHLMLWGLDRSLISDGEIPLFLSFSNGSQMKIQAEVRGIPGKNLHHDNH